MDTFRVVECEHGMLVIGSVSISMLINLSKGFGDGAQVCPGVASAFGRQNGCSVSVAIAKNRASVEAWRAELDAAAAKGNDFEAWWRGTDTGVSSEVIFCVLTGRPYMIRSMDVPRDGADFGRCVRLVRRFAWSDRLDEVSAFDERWKLLVARWGEAEGLYDNEDWKGLRRLIDECVRGEVGHG